jgi:HK97 family phage prohead protease
MKIALSVDQLRASLQAGSEISTATVRESFETEVKTGGERTLVFTISTASVDRMGDTINVNGWKLDEYKKNPVVLWAHDSSSLPLARANRVWIDGEKLKAEAEFTPPGVARFNDTVFELYRTGFMKATSVGFAPLKYSLSDDPKRRSGIDFLEQNLLEFSCCTVPANPEALMDAKSAGIDVTPMIDYHLEQLGRSLAGDELANAVRKIAAKAGLAVVTTERIEAIERAAKAQRLAEQKAARKREFELVQLRSF